MKILGTIGVLALVAGLVLGSASSALAQGPPGKRGLFGTVSSVATITGGYVIELETEEGIFDITADDTAKYMVPRETKGPKDLATFLGVVDENEDDNLEELVGRRLAVLVTFTNTSTADAIRLMLIPSPSSPPSHAHRVGVVDTFTAYDPGLPAADGEILIVDKDDVDHTFTINEDTVYRPSAEDGGISELTGTDLEDALAGGFVTVVTTGNPKLGTAIAKAIVLHEPPLPD